MSELRHDSAATAERLAAFALSLLLVCISGTLEEVTSSNLYYLAEKLDQGKPLPRLTEWIFQHIGHWSDCGIVCIFILPWMLLVLYNIASVPGKAETQHYKLIYGFICFASIEGALFLIFTFSSLFPFIPNYGNYGLKPAGLPAEAYVTADSVVWSSRKHNPCDCI